MVQIAVAEEAEIEEDECIDDRYSEDIDTVCVILFHEHHCKDELDCVEEEAVFVGEVQLCDQQELYHRHVDAQYDRRGFQFLPLFRRHQIEHHPDRAVVLPSHTVMIGDGRHEQQKGHERMVAQFAFVE